MPTRPLVRPDQSPAVYDDHGVGEPSLLLLPGWCGDRSVFAPVAAPAAERRRVVTTDLRGHGASTDVEDFDSARQVDELVALLDDRGIERVVPVALSHAGWLAIELRRRLGAARVPGVVLLDWMVLGPPPGFTEALAGLQSPEDWTVVRAGLFEMWTAGVENASVHEYVASMGEYGFAHWSRAGREISASFAAHGTPLTALDALETPCPTLHLYAQPADPDHLEAQRSAASTRPWFRVERLEASSHFPTFEVPGAIAGHLEEFAGSLG